MAANDSWKATKSPRFEEKAVQVPPPRECLPEALRSDGPLQKRGRRLWEAARLNKLLVADQLRLAQAYASVAADQFKPQVFRFDNAEEGGK